MRAVRTEGASGRLWAQRDFVCGTCSTLRPKTQTPSECRDLQASDIHTYRIKKTSIWPQYAYVPQDGDRKGALTHPTPAVEDFKIWLGSVRCSIGTLTYLP